MSTQHGAAALQYEFLTLQGFTHSPTATEAGPVLSLPHGVTLSGQRSRHASI